MRLLGKKANLVVCERCMVAECERVKTSRDSKPSNCERTNKVLPYTQEGVPLRQVFADKSVILST